ncbi:hypothetical protein H5407_05360 [Mitsuaria sp. WAJ17]|uniref:patatin-like phospholipase family protein n=1 Tax=Mitsuaria sp. WAJ17 TaxID=2761452 RepID=UPI0015FF42F7|nr:patatin-like phospholipase family protein [Mitsuaria sp. WAJ17]MBB2484650.1 hypothetical protein [Mitsuaria sp. WAJ17]
MQDQHPDAQHPDDQHPDAQSPQPMVEDDPSPASSSRHGTARREKLGLALAGGGFRASLFHVGVLRYLARADLLRYVEVLSTVSGGSLVGALYVLQLKQVLEDRDARVPGSGPLRLEVDDYVGIVAEVEARIREIVSQNLRMRLLLNVGRWTAISLGLASLGKHFARYLDAQLFNRVCQQLHKQSAALQRRQGGCPEGPFTDFIRRRPKFAQPRLSLRALRMCAARVDAQGGTENYNHAALWSPAPGAKPASAVTRLIVNTTSLNSSGRFWFSHAEFGEWYLGYVRQADIRGDLWPRKWLQQEARSLGSAQAAPEQVEQALAELSRAYCKEFRVATMPDEAEVRAQMLDRWPLLCWWREAEQPLQWPRLLALQARLASCRQGPAAKSRTVPRLATLLRDIEMGRARQLKNFAWLLRVGRHGIKGGPAVRDGMSDLQLAAGFIEALKAVDDGWLPALGLEPGAGAAAMLQGGGQAQGMSAAPLQDWADALLLLVIEVYQCRCAEFMSPHVWRDWQDMPLSEAVAASASFPPVFPPHVLSTLVDDRKIRALGLTDGGVFDNLGSTALLDEQCTMIIASDPGGVFDTRAREVSVGRIGLMGRLVELLSERPNQLFRHELRERRRMGEAFETLAAGAVGGDAAQFVGARSLTALSTFRIAPAADLNRPGSRGQLLSAVRTDLDVFGPIEQNALIQQGEHQAERHLQRRFAPGAGRPVQVAQRELPDLPGPTAREQDVLAVASHRFLRLPRLWPLSCLLLLVLLMAAAWHWPWPAALDAALVAFWRSLSCLPQGPGLLGAATLSALWAQVAAWHYLPLLAPPALPLAWLAFKRWLAAPGLWRTGFAALGRWLRRSALMLGLRAVHELLLRWSVGRWLFGQSGATWRRRLRYVRGLVVYGLGLVLLPGTLGPLWMMLPLLFALALAGVGLLSLGTTWLYRRLTR